MAKWIKADGTVETVVPAKGKKFTLEELQKYVGGYIEYVPGVRPVMLVDEEGLLKGKPVNAEASWIAGRRLVGDALQKEKGEKSF